MKNKLGIFLLVFFVIPLVAAVYVHFRGVRPHDDIQLDKYVATPTPLQYEYEILIPVAKFTSLKASYQIEELEDVYSLKTNFDKLPEEYQDISLIEEEEILEYLQDGAVILLTQDQIKPTYKTLNINGQNYWHKDFLLEDYPFKKLMIQETYNEEAVEQDKSVFFASGEIIPARAVDRLAFTKYGDYDYVYDFFRADMVGADLSIAMLENSLLGNPVPCTGCTTFRGDDDASIGMANAGIDFLSLAGNHAGDAGQSAYPNTIDLFAALDVKTTGTGRTSGETMTPTVQEVNGRRIGMLAADDIAYFYWSTITNDSTYGTNSFSKTVNGRTVVDYDRVEQIAGIKDKYDIDYLLLYISWGVEYTNKPTSHQEELGRAFIDNGVDMVLGSHPHWVQSVEFYKEKPIFYSFGNFIFDQTHTLPTRQGLVANLYYYGDKLKHIEFMPHQTCGYHQTRNNVLSEYLDGKLTLEEVYALDETKSCVFFQPKKLEEGDPRYDQTLERVFEYTKVN